MRIRSCILVFFVLYIVSPHILFAQTRWMPGGSPYFSTQTINTTQKRDSMREKLNILIHQKANGDHAKSMAIRAYLYEYCGEQAKKYMQQDNIDGKGLHIYQQYTYLQTQLYQSLQPTVQKIRVIMNDKNISFPIVLSHLQSDDSDILYYYGTIPERYVDTVFFSDIATVIEGLRRYRVANDIYPISLTDLITYKFIPGNVMLSNKKILYRAYNLPDVMIYKPQYPMRLLPYEPTYVLLYQAQFRENIQYIDSLDNLRNKIRTYDFTTWVHIKKTPHQVDGEGVGWKIDFPDSFY